MFCVIFEVHPWPERLDDYLQYAAMLRPELVRVDGFVDNVRYRSRRREGWVLSLSTWRDEKALVHWRTHAMHHEAQAKGRSEVFQDYRIRVGQVTADNRVAPGQEPRDQRLDEADAAAKVVSIVEPGRAPGPDENAPPDVRLSPAGEGLLEWDGFDAIEAPGEELLLISWRSTPDAEAAEPTLPPEARRRRVRVVRDYGMFDRREAPQHYPPIARR